MKVKVQDLKPGNMVRTAIGSIVKLETVNVFAEKKPFIMHANGGPQPYFPACVLVTWGNGAFNYTFHIDEEVERVFSAE
jgi:hypothetical protein